MYRMSTNHEECKKELLNYYSRYHFEWFCSLNMSQSNIIDANALIKEWVREMSIKDHIQVACEGVLNYRPQRHIHLLMRGKNDKGQSLLDKDETLWAKGWSTMTHRNAVIEPIENTGVLEYIINKNTPISRHEWLTPYNMRLLKKFAAGN